MRNNYKSKIIKLLVLTIFCFTLPPTHNTFALSYKNNIGIGFTFNPTLSVSLSSPDLVIDNLTPGTTSESNSIEVSVATNAAYGYILTTSVGDSIIYNSTNLIHNNGNNNVFNSISTNASLSSLDDSSDDNIWGYSYKLSSSNTWSNYSGLPSYNSPLKVLLNTDSNDETNNAIDFKIAAKTSSTQASGEYNNVINFSAVTKPTPTTLAEAYANYYSATNKTMHNGYYVMQDMADSHICENTEVISSELQVIDIRDDKVYWIAKLADGKCWMTQNLDLNLVSDLEAENYVALTSENTDLNDISSTTYQDGYTADNGLITWIPKNTTINATATYPNIQGWSSLKIYPSSADFGQIYINSNTNQHGLIGNYYNWTAAIASNNSINETSSSFNSISRNPKNSICPKGWELPKISPYSKTEPGSNDFANLNYYYNNSSLSSDIVFLDSPIYFIRSGYVRGYSILAFDNTGYLQSSSIENENKIYLFYFNSSSIRPTQSDDRAIGTPIRCIAK